MDLHSSILLRKTWWYRPGWALGYRRVSMKFRWRKSSQSFQEVWPTALLYPFDATQRQEGKSKKTTDASPQSRSQLRHFQLLRDGLELWQLCRWQCFPFRCSLSYYSSYELVKERALDPIIPSCLIFSEGFAGPFSLTGFTLLIFTVTFGLTVVLARFLGCPSDISSLCERLWPSWDTL